MSTTAGKKQGKPTPSSEAAVAERLVQLERKVDALCRYLLPSTGQYAVPDVPPVWLVKPAK